MSTSDLPEPTDLADQLRLRPAAAEDLLALWHLANDPAVRRASLISTGPIPLGEHRAWLKQKLSSPDCRIWVLESESVFRKGTVPFSLRENWDSPQVGEDRDSPQAQQAQIGGVIRYERAAPEVAEISFHVAAALRRRGLGTRLLQQTGQRACNELGVRRLRAVVRRENLPSARTLAKAGFIQVDSRPVRGQPCHVFERSGL